MESSKKESTDGAAVGKTRELRDHQSDSRLIAEGFVGEGTFGAVFG